MVKCHQDFCKLFFQIFSLRVSRHGLFFLSYDANVCSYECIIANCAGNGKVIFFLKTPRAQGGSYAPEKPGFCCNGARLLSLRVCLYCHMPIMLTSSGILARKFV